MVINVLVSHMQVEQVEVDHLVQHFFNHAQNDNLGRIANAVLAHGDMCLMTGTDMCYKPECKRLAELASQAVDFAKSGVRYSCGWRVPERQVPSRAGRGRVGPLGWQK